MFLSRECCWFNWAVGGAVGSTPIEKALLLDQRLGLIAEECRRLSSTSVTDRLRREYWQTSLVYCILSVTGRLQPTQLMRCRTVTKWLWSFWYRTVRYTILQ